MAPLRVSIYIHEVLLKSYLTTIPLYPDKAHTWSSDSSDEQHKFSMVIQIKDDVIMTPSQIDLFCSGLGTLLTTAPTLIR